MQSTKLIKLLQSLTAEEFKRLGKFVKSDYFNTDKNLILFYSFLKKHYPTFPPEKMTKEKISETIFPESKFSDAKIRNLMSKLVGILEKYLVELEFGQDDIKRRTILSDALKNRGLHNECAKETQSIIEKLKDSPYRDEEHYYLMKVLHQNLYFSPIQMKMEEMEEIIKCANENLELYYNIAKIKIEGELNARRRLYETTSLKSTAGQNKLEENALYLMMEEICELYKLEDEKLFFSIKKLFLENHNTVQKSEQKFILKHLLGFAIRHVRKNKTQSKKYAKEAFELYKMSNDKNLIAVNGKISTTSFLNIITLSANIGEIEWAEIFIRENEDKLDKKSKEEIKALGLAYIAFYCKNYSKALPLISKTKFKNVLYEVNAKSLSLKSYFELFTSDNSYYELITTYSNSFEKFIKRNPDIGKNKSSSIIHFIRSVKKIAYSIYHNDFDIERKISLGKEINSYSSIIERDWLSSKIK